jgi:predicted small metal-binding protein
MHRHWVCDCGYVAHGDSDEQLVEAAQGHVRNAHGQEIAREDVLRAAQEHAH